MAIQVGESIPTVNLYQMTENGPDIISTDVIFNEKRVVLFALPGAFTPTCSAAHLPSFVVKSDEIKRKGVDAIICISVNDAWVMDAWGKAQHAENIELYGDGSADFTEAVDLVLDLTQRGMGVRSQRYAMIVNNGVVEWIGIDAVGTFENSSAETVLKQL